MPPSDVALRVLKQEIRWVEEGPDLTYDESPVQYSSVSQWDDLEIPGIADREQTAVRVEDELFVDRDLDEIMEPAYLADRDPRSVVFRTVHAASGARRSIIFFREDVAPSKRDLRRM
ncbi:MAG: hypothetical protein Q8W44_07330 [Candidatus Palauibacterales bacterium]|nr:hypothetical protein [Candidatus Palauibacterales bacterium]